MKKLLKNILLCLIIVPSLLVFCACDNNKDPAEDDKKLTISFVVDDEVVDTLKTNGKEGITLPEEPTKDGYVFDGWFIDKNSWFLELTADSLTTAPIVIDTNVYAKWKAETYLIAYELNGGVNGNNPSSYTIESLNVYLEEPTKNGYDFAGWYDNAEFTGQAIESIPTGSMGHKILYAKWNAKPFINATDITLNYTEKTIFIGESFYLEATLTPSNADTEVTYSLENFSPTYMAYITFENGTFTATKAMTITIVASIGTKTASCVVNVIDTFSVNYVTLGSNPNQHITSYTIDSTYILKDSVLDNHKFMGWFLESSYQNQITTFNGQNKNLTLYAKFEVNDFTYYEVGDGYGISFCGLNDHYIVIPSEYNDKPIIEIGASVFEDRESLEHIQLPNTIKTIKSNAFFYCKNLDVVYFSGTTDQWVMINFENKYSNPLYNNEYNLVDVCSLHTENDGYNIFNITTATFISNYAFINHKSLFQINIGDSVESIGANAFDGCVELNTIYLGKNLKKIGCAAFLSCDKVSSVYFGGTIDQWAMIEFEFSIPYYCTNPVNGGTKFFIDNQELSEVNLTTATKVSAFAFQAFAGLKSITLGDSVKTIENDAFFNCVNVTSLVLSPNLTYIGYNAFKNCKKLTRLTLPQPLECIENNAFDGCVKLIEIINKSLTLNIESGSSECGKVAFYARSVVSNELNSKIIVKDNFIFFNDNETYYLESCINPEGLIYLPENINGNKYIIDSYAFQYEDSLIHLVITTGIKGIKSYAFSGCNNLKIVTYTGTIDEWVQINFENNSTPLGQYFYINNELVKNVVLNTATKINNYAFSGYDYIETLTTGSSVLSIGKSAFEDCDRLISIKLSNVLNIEDSAFRYCNNLVSIVLANNIESVGYACFEGCSKLKNITLPDNIINIGAAAFSHCISLNNIYLPNNLTRITSGLFAGCENLESVTIGENIEYIDRTAFISCEKLRIVYYKGSLKEKNLIEMVNQNFEFENFATWYYYSETNPFEGEGAVTEGNFWHYDEDGVTPIVWSKED